MKIKILIQDNKKIEQADLMGLEPSDCYDLTDFYFRDTLVESFWVDEVAGDIVFSLGGDDYRTPYSDEMLEKFKKIL